MEMTFKVDSLTSKCNIRVNVCVTEQKDNNNVPVMHFTPNKENYIQVMSIGQGMNQEVMWHQCKFDIKHLQNYNLQKTVGQYYPLIININYLSEGKQYAFMSYGEFTIDNASKLVNGVRITKQVILVSSMPINSQIDRRNAFRNKEYLRSRA